MQETSISFEPHLKTLTDSGRSHFQRPSDALAEFVDNSIQACRGAEPSRNISINLFLAGKQAPGFIVVTDNGCGMSVQTIKEFATFSLDQETRNNVAKENDKSFIGKFGVGAKQAGFYLGTRIKLFTKTTVDANILTFSLDSEELQRRYSEQISVYEGSVVSFQPTPSWNMLQEDENYYKEMNGVVCRHLESVPQGTAFIIKLRPEITSRLREMGESVLAEQIAEIYHFHLHPEHSFQNIVNVLGQVDDKATKRSRLSAIDSIEETPLLIHYEYYNQEKSRVSINLHEANNYAQACVSSMVNVFRFTMEVPDPVPENSYSNRATQFSQVGGHAAKCPVHGFLFYCPFQNGAETKPQFESTLVNAAGSNSSSSAAAGNEDYVGVQQDRTIQVYWQNRLVPESLLAQLPFFPTSQALSKYDIAKDWKKRIGGFLFFDWSFRHISNNKLKILVEPNLNTWLNSTEVKKNTIFHPKDANSEFADWLQRCHKEFDREFLFLDRDLSNNESNTSVFKQVKFRHLQPPKVLSVGDKIKWKANSKGTTLIYAEIVDFVIPERLSVFDTYYFGSGNIRYRRLPLELFGDSQQLTSITNVDAADCMATAVELNALQKEAPHCIKFYLFETLASEPIDMVDGSAELIAGTKYTKVGMQILNKDGKLAWQIPDGAALGRSNCFTIEIHDSDGKDYGKTRDLWKTNSKTAEDEQVTNFSKRDCKQYFYAVYNIKFDRPGDRQIIARVLAPDGRTLVETVCPVVVLGMTADKFGLTEDSFTDVVPLGQPFPNFRLQFFDTLNNPVSYEGDIKITIESKDMKVQPRDRSKEYIRKVSFADQGIFECKAAEWVVVPKENKVIFSRDRVISEKEVSFTMKVFTPLEDVHGKVGYTLGLGEAVEFKVRFTPGLPAKFCILQPTEEPVTIKNGEPLPILHLAVMDNWNNRTTPQGSDAWELVFGNGPFSSKANVTINAATGEAVCSVIACTEIAQVPVEGKIVHQVLDLLSSNANSTSHFAAYELPIKVVPAVIPTKAKVYYEGKEIQDKWTVQAGAELEDLTFEVFDDIGNAVDLSKVGTSMKSSWMECSWAAESRSKRKKLPIAGDKVLPTLSVPEDVGSIFTEQTLELMIDGMAVEATFTLNIIAAAPVQWKLITSPSIASGLIQGDGNDLKNKVVGVCLVDQFGNKVDCNSVQVCPTVVISAVGSEDEDDKTAFDFAMIKGQLQLTESNVEEKGESSSSNNNKKKRKRDETEDDSAALIHLRTTTGYVFAANPVVTGYNLGTRLRIFAKDTDKLFQHSEDVVCEVVRGSPKKVMLSSAALNLTQLAAQQRCELSKFSKVSDLVLHIVDDDNNPANVKDIQQLKVEIIGPKKKKVFSSSSSVANEIHASLNYDFASVTANCGDSSDDDEATGTAPASTNSNKPIVAKFRCKVSFKRGKETVTLPEASLLCTITRYNNVVDLKLQAFVNNEVPTLSQYLQSTQQRNNVPLHRDDHIYHLELICGSSVPTFILMAETDDGLAYAPELESFSVSAKKRVDKDRQRLSFMDLFEPELDPDNFRIIFSPTEKFVVNQACVYELDLVYAESRPQFASLPEPMKNIKIQLHITIAPGPIAKLCIDKASLHILQNRTVSNSNEAQKRLLGEKIKLHVEDEFKNPRPFEKTHEVRCEVIACHKSQGVGTIPKLQSEDASGVTRGVISKSAMDCVFNRIQLMDASATKDSHFQDGTYTLYFTLVDVAHNTQVARLYAGVDFAFTSNDTYSKRANDIQDQLRPLLIQRDSYNQKLAEINECTRKLKVFVRSPNMTEAIQGAMEDIRSLEDLRARREREIEDMKSRVTQHRQAHKRSNALDPARLKGKNVIGMVVDLAFIDDHDEAEIISWAAMSAIDAVVVPDTETAKELYKSKVKVTALDQIIPFKITERGSRHQRTRNEQELQTGVLELTPIVMKDRHGKSIKPTGNPRYIVNLLQLKPDMESLRDTLFFNIFNTSILFDDMNSALDYRKYLVENGIRPPTMYTLEGTKLTSQAILDPGPSGTKPARLEYVFGEQPSRVFESIRAGNELELINEIIEVARERETLQRDFRSIDIEAIQERINILEEKQGELQTQLSQP